MSERCKIKFFKGDEWIFVTLYESKSIPVDILESEAEVWEWIGNYVTWGLFSVRENSVTGDVYSGKFVLPKSSPQDAFWAYDWSRRELNFIERGHWVGGGLGYGEQELRFRPALTLHDARLTGQGIEPMDRSGTGRATVKKGGYMNMLSNIGNVVSWEWRDKNAYAADG